MAVVVVIEGNEEVGESANDDFGLFFGEVGDGRVLFVDERRNFLDFTGIETSIITKIIFHNNLFQNIIRILNIIYISLYLASNKRRRKCIYGKLGNFKLKKNY